MSALLLRRCSVAPGVETDLAIVDGRIAVDAPAGAQVVDVEGRPVIPGLADHHVHLLALAAAWDSVDLSPGALTTAGGLAAGLAAARTRRPEGWLRGVGYDVAASGDLDRGALDVLQVGPVRVQDRSGICWILDSAGLASVLPADAAEWPAGVETDGAGRPTGRLFRVDGWLRARLPTQPPDLAPVGRWLASRGVTAVTDAGAENGAEEVALLAAAALPQRLMVMTASAEWPATVGVACGAVKTLLDEAALPGLDELRARVAGAHEAGRPVAVHCVDATSLTLALAAGVGPRDRIEHASIVPEPTIALVRQAGVTVVTQPGLVASRGDRYLAEVEPADRASLYRLRSLQDAGVPVAGGSDAPYGPADPWAHVRAALSRRTASGVQVGVDEALDVGTALALFTGHLDEPIRQRRLLPGEPADLVVLGTEWSSLARDEPVIQATLVAGSVIHGELAS